MKTIDVPGFVSGACSFLKNTLDREGFTRVCIGISGGIDSAVVASLCVKALGNNRVACCLFPSGTISDDSYNRSRELVSHLHIPDPNIIDRDISSVVESFCSHDPYISTIRRANIMARVRMILLYDTARKYQCLVAGTENKSEYLLGYFTRFGDEASDIELVRTLFKTQVYSVARYLSVPESICTARPSAGLWEGQTDEEELGFSYEKADEILHLIADEKLSEKSIVDKGYDEGLVSRVVQRVKAHAFKHHVPHVFTYPL